MIIFWNSMTETRVIFLYFQMILYMFLCMGRDTRSHYSQNSSLVGFGTEALFSLSLSQTHTLSLSFLCFFHLFCICYAQSLCVWHPASAHSCCREINQHTTGTQSTVDSSGVYYVTTASSRHSAPSNVKTTENLKWLYRCPKPLCLKVDFTLSDDWEHDESFLFQY